MSRAAISVDAVFHALGDPTRRAIIGRLGKGPQSVTSLADPLKISITAVSQHLTILEKGGLVQTKKSGRVRTCHIKKEGFTMLEKWIAEHCRLWESRLDRLGDLLAESDD